MPEIETKTQISTEKDGAMRPIFIVGTPRSGSTLLQSLIASHPDVCSCPETLFFESATRSIMRPQQHFPPVGKWGVRRSISRLKAEEMFGELAFITQRHLDTGDFYQHGKDRYGTRELFEYYLSFINGRRYPHFVEKSTTHIYYIPEINDLYPEARIIYIVRDPRDYVLSFKKLIEQKGNPARPLYELCHHWNDACRISKRWNLFTVRYEDLVSDVEDTLSQVSRFLGLDLAPYREKERDNVLRSITRFDEIWKRNVPEKITRRHIGKFKHLLTEQDVQRVENICRRYMREFGYSLQYPGNRSRGARAGRWKYWARRIQTFGRLITGSRPVKLPRKLSKVCKIIRHFKNPFRVIKFRNGNFVKGEPLIIRPRRGDIFTVERYGDFGLIDSILEGKAVRKVSSDGGRVLLKIDGVYLRERTSDTYVYKEIFCEGCYTKCLPAVSKDSTVIDLGANIGLFSLLLSPLVKRIYAYEAEKENFEMALKNISENRADNVHIHHRAVWTESGHTLFIAASPPDYTAERHVASRLPDDQTTSGHVTSVSLEDIFLSNQIDTCDLLKIDIEGGEYELLMSLPDDIYRRIRYIVCEYHLDRKHQERIREAVERLKNKGFETNVEQTHMNTSIIYARRIR